MSGLFDVGPYFNVFSQNIIKGVIPSAQFKGATIQQHRHSLLLVAFFQDFADMFDSTNAVWGYLGEQKCDLRRTMQYKLLITCGTFIRVNKKTKQQVVWVEETRSVQLNSFQKEELIEAIGADPAVAENSNLMAVAIEFRLKPLI